MPYGDESSEDGYAGAEAGCMPKVGTNKEYVRERANTPLSLAYQWRRELFENSRITWMDDCFDIMDAVVRPEPANKPANAFAESAFVCLDCLTHA